MEGGRGEERETAGVREMRWVWGLPECLTGQEEVFRKTELTGEKAKDEKERTLFVHSFREQV